MKEFIKKNKEIILYLIVGGLTTVVSLLTYYLVTISFLDPHKKIELAIANIISWVFAVTFAYILNRVVVFKSKNSDILKEGLKFYLYRVSTLLIDLALMFLLVNILNFNDRLSKLLVQVIVIILNYILSKFLIFNNK